MSLISHCSTRIVRISGPPMLNFWCSLQPNQWGAEVSVLFPPNVWNLILQNLCVCSFFSHFLFPFLPPTKDLKKKKPVQQYNVQFQLMFCALLNHASSLYCAPKSCVSVCVCVFFSFLVMCFVYLSLSWTVNWGFNWKWNISCCFSLL